MSHALSKTNFCTCCSFCLVHTLSSSPTKSSFALSISTPPQVLAWLSSLLGSLPCIPGFKKWPHLGTQSGYLGKCGFPSALAQYGSGGHYWWVSTMGNSNLGGKKEIVAHKIYIYMFLCFNMYFNSCDFLVCLIPKLPCCLSTSPWVWCFRSYSTEASVTCLRTKTEITALETTDYSNTEINTPWNRNFWLWLMFSL